MIRDAWGSLPPWGRVIVVLAVCGLLGFALWLGRDLTPIWGLLGGN